MHLAYLEEVVWMVNFKITILLVDCSHHCYLFLIASEEICVSFSPDMEACHDDCKKICTDIPPRMYFYNCGTLYILHLHN